jgi:hypothetical protein
MPRIIANISFVLMSALWHGSAFKRPGAVKPEEAKPHKMKNKSLVALKQLGFQSVSSPLNVMISLHKPRADRRFPVRFPQKLDPSSSCPPTCKSTDFCSTFKVLARP